MSRSRGCRKYPEHPVGIGYRVAVTGTEIHPVRLSFECGDHIGLVERLIGDHPLPIRLVGWRRCKRRVGADGWQEDEQRRAAAPLALKGIDLRQ